MNDSNKGKIILGGPAPEIPSIFFTFGPAPTLDGTDSNCGENKTEPKTFGPVPVVDCIDGIDYNIKNETEIFLGAPCPPLQKIYFEKEKNDNTST